MVDRCRMAGIRQPEFRIDAGYFILTLWRRVMAKIHAELPGIEAQIETRLESRLESQLESALAVKILLILKSGEFGKSGMASELGHKTVSGELHKQVKRLLERELIEMTIPEKPNSHLQKYRLTGKGKTFLTGKS